jgi:hypothetical protein
MNEDQVEGKLLVDPLLLPSSSISLPSRTSPLSSRTNPLAPLGSKKEAGYSKAASSKEWTRTTIEARLRLPSHLLPKG